MTGGDASIFAYILSGLLDVGWFDAYDQVGQIIAHLMTEGQLSVGESTSTEEASGDMAIRLAVDALLSLVFGSGDFQ